MLDNAPAAQTAPTNTPTIVPATVPTTGSPATTGAGILDELNRYTSGQPATTAPTTAAPDTSAPAAPVGSQVPTSQ